MAGSRQDNPSTVRTVEDRDVRTECKTRILSKKDTATTMGKDKKHRQRDNKNDSRMRSMPNVLVLMIDPISRSRFNQNLFHTQKLLSNITDFVTFTNYTAVGNNSGPNQAALYSGLPLLDRQRLTSHGTQKGSKWMWDELREAGYSTFKAENGCIKNSNMMQSIQPNTTHGSAMHEMMCFDFSRPNCIGETSAANHLTTFASQFIAHYAQKGKPWAAFLHFIDSHEDTGMLAGTLDTPIRNFLQLLRQGIEVGDTRYFLWEKTVIVLVSDHGLHYGPYFQSKQGLIERYESVLQIKLASSFPGAITALKRNSDKYTTPFDVHKTLIHATVGAKESETNPLRHGISLLSPLPTNRSSCRKTEGIPAYYCDLIDSEKQSQIHISEMPFPPSILSYYADIPKGNRPSGELYSLSLKNKAMLPSKVPLHLNSSTPEINQNCLCATSHKKWHTCHTTGNPLASPRDVLTSPNEHFALVDCPNQTLHLEIRILRKKQLGERFKRVQRRKNSNAIPRTTAATTNPPNILFVEIDSVSIAYANRHFVKTRELLQKHRIHSYNDATGSKRYSCPSGLCAADFSYFSIIGPHSISNQVAALSGCLASPPGDSCSIYHHAVNGSGMVCEDENASQSGLQMSKYHARNHKSYWCMPGTNLTEPINPSGLYPHPLIHNSTWLYEIARKVGYVTLFGEEFCWWGSPYVTQNQFVPLNADINPWEVFCRLAERTARIQNLDQAPGQRWKAENPQEPCIDGFSGTYKARASLDFIREMWDTYSDDETPKFAFLNAIAAHNYDADWSTVTLSAELYDDILSSFLEKMLSRADSNNTVIVIRADHGLQSGPLTGDYSTQVEHVRPWTEIIVPESLHGLSLEALVANQERLASGFDLYRTLRALMATPSAGGGGGGGGSVEPETFVPPVPDWSYNLLTTAIPETRSCKDGRIPLDWCRTKDLEPGVGVCNLYDSTQKLHCRTK